MLHSDQTRWWRWMYSFIALLTYFATHTLHSSPCCFSSCAAEALIITKAVILGHSWHHEMQHIGFIVDSWPCFADWQWTLSHFFILVRPHWRHPLTYLRHRRKTYPTTDILRTVLEFASGLQPFNPTSRHPLTIAMDPSETSFWPSAAAPAVTKASCSMRPKAHQTTSPLCQ